MDAYQESSSIQDNSINDNVMISLNSTESLHLEEQAETQNLKLILSLLEKVEGYFIKLKQKGNIIKKADFKIDEEHIFSKSHINNGILKLGKDRKAILKKFRDMIEDADIADVLKDDVNNQIRTVINGYKIEVRAFVKNGDLKSFNAFLVKDDWPNTNFGNIIYLAPKYND